MDYTQADVDKILKASKKATRGPWNGEWGSVSTRDDRLGCVLLLECVTPNGEGAVEFNTSKRDANVILAAGAPILAEEVKRLRAENERLHSDLVFLRREYVCDAIDRTL